MMTTTKVPIRDLNIHAKARIMPAKPPIALGQGVRCHRCLEDGHTARECVAPLKCFRCRANHYAVNCQVPRRKSRSLESLVLDTPNASTTVPAERPVVKTVKPRPLAMGSSGRYDVLYQEGDSNYGQDSEDESTDSDEESTEPAQREIEVAPLPLAITPALTQPEGSDYHWMNQRPCVTSVAVSERNALVPTIPHLYVSHVQHEIDEQEIERVNAQKPCTLHTPPCQNYAECCDLYPLRLDYTITNGVQMIMLPTAIQGPEQKCRAAQPTNDEEWKNIDKWIADQIASERLRKDRPNFAKYVASPADEWNAKQVPQMVDTPRPQFNTSDVRQEQIHAQLYAYLQNYATHHKKDAVLFRGLRVKGTAWLEKQGVKDTVLIDTWISGAVAACSGMTYGEQVMATRLNTRGGITSLKQSNRMANGQFGVTLMDRLKRFITPRVIDSFPIGITTLDEG